MELFKNGVGRPSNETLRNRRTIKIILVLVVLALVCSGVYFIYDRTAMKDVTGTGKNTQVGKVFADIEPVDTQKTKGSNDTKNQYYQAFNTSGAGNIKVKVDVHKNISRIVYYRIFTYSNGKYSGTPKTKTTCYAMPTKSKEVSKTISINLSDKVSMQSVKAKVYTTKSLCTKDTKGTLDTGFGKEGTSASAFRLIKLGDSNADGNIDGKDLVHLNNHLSGKSKITSDLQLANSDTYKDGKNNSVDALVLRLYLAYDVKKPMTWNLFGDVTGDKETDGKDLIRLNKFLSDNKTQMDTGNGDLNLDGKINATDAEILRKFLAEKEEEVSTGKVLFGDIDGNGKVTSADAKLISRFLTKINGYQMGDVNKNGKVDEDDATLILYYTLMPNKYPFDSTQKKLADVNGDGAIDSDDAIYVKKIATGYGDIATAADYTKGDGKLTQDDATLILYYTLMPNKYPFDSTQKKLADVNGDGAIDSDDAGLVSKFLTKVNGYQMGDVNKNGKIDEDDATLILYHSSLTSEYPFDSTQKKLADVNGDGAVDSDDAIYVKKIATGYGDVATAADYTKGDGKLTQDDADAILKKATGN